MVKVSFLLTKHTIKTWFLYQIWFGGHGGGRHLVSCHTLPPQLAFSEEQSWAEHKHKELKLTLKRESAERAHHMAFMWYIRDASYHRYSHSTYFFFTTNYNPNELWSQNPHRLESDIEVPAGLPTANKKLLSNDILANEILKGLYDLYENMTAIVFKLYPFLHILVCLMSEELFFN